MPSTPESEKTLQATLRACDVCRRRKIKCEFSLDAGKCTRCDTFNLDCTYDIPIKKRGPARGYVLELEARVKQLEKLLNQVLSAPDASKRLTASPVKHESTSRPIDTPIGILPKPVLHRFTNDTYDSSSDEDDAPLENNGVPRWLSEMSPDGGPGGFPGFTSNIHLVRSALQAREHYLDSKKPFPNFDGKFWRTSFWIEYPSMESRQPGNFKLLPGQAFDFPDPDLLARLITIYFEQTNSILPLLNQILFRKQVAEGLQYENDGFGAVVLLVAAVGSRGCDDPRVLTDPAATQSAGWKWFTQVYRMRRPLMATSTLYDVQIVALSVIFLHCCTSPDAGWNLLGLGIQFAVDMGAHRRKAYGSKPTVHSELWKRAVWVLIILDRFIACGMGKMLTIRDEDFDLDLPIECDDEYWFADNPDDAFRQPANKICIMSHFIHQIKHFQIVAFTLRTLFTLSRSRASLGLTDPEWEKRIVAQCDSALNEWRANIPEHLRWDPMRQPDQFSHYSAMLEAFYYQLQIIIHRPFIPRVGKKTVASSASLAICVNAARCIAKIVQVDHARAVQPFAWHIMASFVAGVTLVLHVVFKKKPQNLDFKSEIEGTRACLRALERCEKAWQIAGQFRDIICELMDSHGLLGSNSELTHDLVTTKPDTNSKMYYTSLFSELAGALDSGSPSASHPDDYRSTTQKSNASDIASGTIPELPPPPLTSPMASTEPVFSIPPRSATQWGMFSAPPTQDPAAEPRANLALAWNMMSIPDLNDPHNLFYMASSDGAPSWQITPNNVDLNHWSAYI